MICCGDPELGEAKRTTTTFYPFIVTLKTMEDLFLRISLYKVIKFLKVTASSVMQAPPINLNQTYRKVHQNNDFNPFVHQTEGSLWNSCPVVRAAVIEN